MRRVVVSLALVGCRPQAGPIAAAPEVALAPVSVAAAAPSVPEPGPPDRDGDTVPDDRDQCPDEPEDLDHFEDDDGCVDRDNDGDRVLDALEFKNGRWTNCERLTGRVAEVVIAELVRRGIDRARLEPIGWGDEKPLARNDSAEHRKDNRRVEFNVKSCGRDSLNRSGEAVPSECG